MKKIQIYRKKDKVLVTTSLEAIIAISKEAVTEFEVMRAIHEMVDDNEIKIIKHKSKFGGKH